MYSISGREIPRLRDELTNALMIVLFLLDHVDALRMVFDAVSLRNYKTSKHFTATA